MRKDIEQDKEVDLSKRTMLRTALVAGGMFGFGFAMVPIYDVFCKVTGLNGKTDPNPYTGKAEVDTSRIIKVQFVATRNAGMSWDFRPDVFRSRGAPGTGGEKLSFLCPQPDRRTNDRTGDTQRNAFPGNKLSAQGGVFLFYYPDS